MDGTQGRDRAAAERDAGRVRGAGRSDALERRPDERDILAQRLRKALAPHENVREVRMFGGLSFLVDERIAVAAGRDGDLLVRADPAHYDELVQRGGEAAHMGKDRPMGRGWLTVRHQLVRHDDELAYWVGVGIDSRGADR